MVDGAAEDINEVWHGGNASEQSVREVNKAEKEESRNGKYILISRYQQKSQE